MFEFDYKAFYIVLSILGSGLLGEVYRYLKMKKTPLSASRSTDGHSGILMIMLVNMLIGVCFFSSSLLAVYRTNAIAPLFEIGVSFCLISLLAHYFYPKLAHFAGCTTIGDIIERTYGKVSRTFTTCITAFCCFLMVVAPLVALGQVAEAVGFSRLLVIVLFSLLLVGYSSLNQRDGLSFLGVVKFLSLGIGITYLFGQVMSHYSGSMLSLRKAVTQMGEELSRKEMQTRFTPFSYDTTDSLLSAFFWIGWPTLLLSPPVIQQLLKKKKTSTTKQGVIYFGLIYSLLKLILLGIALFMFVQMESGVPKEGAAFFYLLQNGLAEDTSLAYQVLLLLMYCTSLLGTAYLFFKALMVIIADYLPTTASEKIPIPNRFTHLLVYLVGGSLATFCAYYANEIPPTYLVGFAIGLLGALTIPLLAAVLGLVGHKKIFLYSVGAFLFAGFLGVALDYAKRDWLVKGLRWIGCTLSEGANTRYYLFLLIVQLSTIIFLYLHYQRYGRFRYLKRAPLSTDAKSKKEETSWMTRFYAPLDWATTQLRYCGKALELLGVIFVIGYLVWGTPWHHHETNPQVHRYIALLGIIRMCGIILATGLILRPIWPVRYQRFFPLYWLMTLWFCIPFTNALLFLHGPNELVFFSWCLLSSLLLGVMVDRETFLSLMITGPLPAWAIYHFGIPFVDRYHGLDGLTLFHSGACMALILLIRLFFIGDKDISHFKKQHNNTLLTRHFYQEFDHALATIAIEDLKKVLDQEVTMKQQDNGELLWAFNNQQSYQKLISYISKYERQRKACQLKNIVFTKLLLDQPSDTLYRQELTVADSVRSLYQQLSPAYQVKVHVEAIDPSYTIWIATPFFDYIMQSILYYAVRGRTATHVAIHWNSIKKCLSIIDNGTPLPQNQKELFNLDNIRYYSQYALPLIKLVLRKMEAKMKVYQEGNKQVFEIFFPENNKPPIA